MKEKERDGKEVLDLGGFVISDDPRHEDGELQKIIKTDHHTLKPIEIKNEKDVPFKKKNAE